MRFASFLPLIVISALVIFSPIQEGGTTHSAQMIIRLLILFLLAFAIGQSIQAGQFHLPISRIAQVTGVFLGFACLSTLLSPYSHPSRQWLMTIIGYALLFHLVPRFINGWKRIAALTAVIISVGVGEAAWAIVQKVIWSIDRPSGTFFNPNFLAGYLALTWALLLSLALYGVRKRQMVENISISSWLWWSGFMAVLGIVAVAVVLTGSRGGVLVCLLATVSVVVERYGWKQAAICGGLLIVLIVLGPFPIRDRILQEHQHNPATYARWQIWQTAIQQMLDHPTGIGLGLYQYSYSLHAVPVEGEIARYGYTAQTPHNDYLQLGVEMGVGAVVALLAIVWLVWREQRKLLVGELGGWERGVVVGLGSGGTALLAHAAIDSSLRESAIAIALLLSGGMILAARRFTSSNFLPFRLLPIRSKLLWRTGAVGVLAAIVLEVVRLGTAWAAFESASQYAVNGNTASAIRELKQAISLDPGKSMYHHSLGSLYAKVFEATGDSNVFQQAQREFAEAIALNPLDHRLPGLLARLHLTASQSGSSSMRSRESRNRFLNAAIEAYEREIQLSPFSAMPRYEQGRVYYMLGISTQAERRATEAIELEPNCLPARDLVARIWFAEGRAESAVAQLHEIVARQQQYQGWRRGGLEEAFLSVDVPSLRAALHMQGRVG